MKLSLRLYILPLLLIACLFGCQEPATNSNPPANNPQPVTPAPTSYLALGDSYTIGESVEEEQRWPVQLSRQLSTNSDIDMELPKIIARTGWTTDELAAAIKQQNPSNRYDLVSLLIGVNNQYRGYEFSRYEEEFVELLDTAIEKAGGRGNKVFVVSIPDYGVTPFGQSGNPDIIAAELDAYNDYAKQVCANRGIAFFDITPISRGAKDNPGLVAKDGLHPSGEMYRLWVELMKDSVKNIVLAD